MKGIKRILAAVLSAVIVFCTAYSPAAAYTDGTHDTGNMTVITDISFGISAPYLSTSSQRELFYDEESDSFYYVTRARADKVIFTPSEGVTFEDIREAFARYKEDELPNEEVGINSNEKQYLSEVVIEKDGEKICAEIPVTIVLRLLASFCQKNAELFESVEYRKKTMYMLKIGEPFCITQYDTSTASAYIKENGLEWTCKSAAVRVHDGKAYRYIDGVTISFPDDMSEYESAQAAYDMRSAMENSILYTTIEDSCECSWESVDLLSMSTAVPESTTPPQAVTFAWDIVSTLKGDANNDFKVNIADAVKILQFIANSSKYPLTDQERINADCDGAPGITGSDAINVQKIDAGII